MSVHDEMLGFLDGSLSAEAEAELLHRMSVSPERRALLRSYFQQQSLIAQDKQSINVPFEAEQGLWARLDKLMPAAPAAIPMASSVATMTAASSAGFFSRFSMAGSALMASLLLMLGFGGGYLAGNSTNGDVQLASVASNTPAPATQIVYRDAEPKIIEKERVVTRYITRYVTIPVAGPAIAAVEEVDNDAVMTDMSAVSHSSAVDAMPGEPVITLARPVAQPEAQINVGGEQLKPIFARTAEIEEAPEKSVLERFEFSFNESFGRQYPNTVETNNSLPLITNSSFSLYFQVLPRSEKLWAGISVGTANVTRKELRTDPISAFGDEEIVRGDYRHVQTNWAGGFLQYRMPTWSSSVDAMFTGGYGFSGAGNMLIGEVGAHVDVTKDVGFTLGLRGTRLSYDLKGEMEELMDNRKGSLSVPRGVTDATPSYNLELATGLFFHF